MSGAQRHAEPPLVGAYFPALQARLGVGVGVFFGGLIIAAAVPQARMFIRYEYETQPKRLFIARILALVAFAISFGAVVNELIEATSKSYNCVEEGCGNDWKDSSGDSIQTVSRYVMMKGAINTLSVLVVQQMICWVCLNADAFA